MKTEIDIKLEKDLKDVEFWYDYKQRELARVLFAQNHSTLTAHAKKVASLSTELVSLATKYDYLLHLVKGYKG